MLQGFLVSPIESLLEISIGDLVSPFSFIGCIMQPFTMPNTDKKYFAHERGFYIGIYAMSLFGLVPFSGLRPKLQCDLTLFSSNYLAPLLAGFIDDGQGWHWVMYWSAIWNAGAALILFFCMEETNYHRRRPEVNSTEPSTPAEPSSQQSAEKAEKDVVNATSRETASGSTVAGSGLLNLSVYKSGRIPLEGTPTPYVKRLRMFHDRWTSNKVLGILIYRPLLLFRFPVVVWLVFPLIH